MSKYIENYLDVLGPEGVISRRMKQYELRSEQLTVSGKVAEAFHNRSHLAIEAGTGVGKSFAYLVPAILYAVEGQIDEVKKEINRELKIQRLSDHPENKLDPPEIKTDRHCSEQAKSNINLSPSDKTSGSDSDKIFEYRSEKRSDFDASDTKETNSDDLLDSEEFDVLPFSGADEKHLRKIVVSTHTISLQEQLMEKDIPFLRSILPYEFTAVLVKGRSNYLCLRRLNQVIKKGPMLFEFDSSETLEMLLQWSKETPDGSLSDLATKPKPEIWNEVSCEQGNCLGRNCPWYEDCFYNKARRRVFHAQVLVVNHALLFSDMALRRGSGGGILPSYDNLIIDEAHTIEQTAAEHLGMCISQGQVDYLLYRLYNERAHKGLLVEKGPDYIQAQDLTVECRARAEEFFESLLTWLVMRPNSNGRIQEPNIVRDVLSPALLKLSAKIRNLTARSNDAAKTAELAASVRKLQVLADNINFWFNQNDAEQVYWLEKTVSRRRERVSLMSAPIDVGPILREQLFSKISSVIMTSATLTTGDAKKKNPTQKEIDRDFTFFRSRIGLTSVQCCQVGSPFNYRQQLTLVIPKNIPNPDEYKIEYQIKIQKAFEKYLDETDGGAFVLFTSWAFLKKMAERMTHWLTEKNIPFFSQSDGMPRSRMIEEFKKNRRSVLFGTDSFWQGVDVPGESLRNVIITKLPFLVPSHPLTEARLQAIELHGGSAFRDYQLPHAILKFKQGFGRLIRSKTDSGLVVILDPRIHTKSYGKSFLRALPECKMRVDDWINFNDNPEGISDPSKKYYENDQREFLF